MKLKYIITASLAVVCCYAHANMPVTYFVNGTMGSDENDGIKPSSAKKTIQSAVDIAFNGDKIFVLPGTYGPIVTGNKRIVIVGTAGADKTLIDGQKKSRCVLVMKNPEYRVDHEVATNTVIKGMTIRNGALSDGYGAGAFGGSFESCRFIDNRASDGGGGACCECLLKNCLITGSYANNGGACMSCVLQNCTIVGNSVRASGSSDFNCDKVNCIVYGNTGGQSIVVRTSEWPSYLIESMGGEYRSVNCVSTDPKFRDEPNGDYRLTEESQCIDAGENAHVQSSTDLDGKDRILNGRVDIGCYEYGCVAEDFHGKTLNYDIICGEAILMGVEPNWGVIRIPERLSGHVVTGIKEGLFSDFAPNAQIEFLGKPISGVSEAGIGNEMFVWYNAMYKAEWQEVLNDSGLTRAEPYKPCACCDMARKFSVSVTNVVVNYIFNSIQPEFALPATSDRGFVNIIAEVKGGVVSVPESWATEYPKFTEKFGSDFTRALAMKTGKKDGAGNPMFVWQDYVAGTDPTDETDVFTASITIVDGKVQVSYSPELDDARKALRKYTTWGKKSLMDNDWTEVQEGQEAEYNFFKVTVEML